MREMKDSGISWVGEIPKEWRCLPIRALFTENRNKNFLGRETKALQFKYGTIVPKKNFDPEENYVAETILNYNIVDRGMIMLNGLNLNFDFVSKRIALVAERGIITSAYMSFYPTDTTIVLSEYANYLLKSYDNCAAFHNMGGGVRKILNFDELKRQYFVLPPLVEQQRIAEFLDRECGKIDGLKADIQAQIDTLEQYKRSVITEAVTHGLNPSAPMKDSGVDYIDKIKINWRITKIGFVCSKLTRGFSAEDPALICSNNGSVMLRDEEKACGKMVSEDNAMQGIHIGDIAIHGMDTWHGAIGFSKIKGKITRVVHVCDSTEDKRFIVYYLKSLAYQNVYKLISNGVRGNTSDFRSWDKVKDIYICLPATKKEENEICDYLDAQCENIDMIIADKKSQIETLDGYKKSLIYEYVTGKKEVICDG